MVAGIFLMLSTDETGDCSFSKMEDALLWGADDDIEAIESTARVVLSILFASLKLWALSVKYFSAKLVVEEEEALIGIVAGRLKVKPDESFGSVEVGTPRLGPVDWEDWAFAALDSSPRISWSLGILDVFPDPKINGISDVSLVAWEPVRCEELEELKLKVKSGVEDEEAMISDELRCVYIYACLLNPSESFHL